MTFDDHPVGLTSEEKEVVAYRGDEDGSDSSTALGSLVEAAKIAADDFSNHPIHGDAEDPREDETGLEPVETDGPTIMMTVSEVASAVARDAAEQTANQGQPHLLRDDHNIQATHDGALDQAAPANDLAELPGIGPGLVWLLNGAGIRSMADLAEANGRTLEVKLGLVGELIDLDRWIQHASKST